jgi:hypothetical protein
MRPQYVIFFDELRGYSVASIDNAPSGVKVIAEHVDNIEAHEMCDYLTNTSVGQAIRLVDNLNKSRYGTPIPSVR